MRSSRRMFRTSARERMSRVSGIIFVVFGFLFGLGLVACGGGGGTTPALVPDFSLAATPASVSVTTGASGQTISVTAAAINTFSGTVAVAITGLPAGVTASPAMLTLTPGSAQNVTVTAASSAAAGSATLTFTGTSGALSHAATVALTI